MRKKSYAQMRTEGLCPKCGKLNPTPERSRCPDCAERDRQQRRQNAVYLKKIGICVRCKKNPAEPHKTLCYECIGKDYDSYHQRERTEDERERDRLRKRELSARRLANGLCPQCGKHKSLNGGICKSCRAKQAQYRNDRRADIPRSERPAYGVCYICGDNSVIPGKKVCEKCYQTRLKTLPAMWDNMDNEYFRQLNYARVCMIKSGKNKNNSAPDNAHIF